MHQPKISIIVPIYKVEKYLKQCLDSILNQTYQNMEIILVDDGSPDGCGMICDAYAAKDDRFRVIHQTNDGVAAARNAGLAAATGEWIGWVDADDWLEPDMFEYLLENALSANADICICGRFEELRRRTSHFGITEKKLMNQAEALYALLEERYMDSALYDKLWRRELFRDIRFPAGRTYEDLATLYRLFTKAEWIMCLPEPKYHYRRRNDGIVGDTSLPNRMDHYLAARQRYSDMTESYPELQSLLEGRCITAAIGIWCGYYHNPISVRREYAPQLCQIAQFSRPRIKKVLNEANCGLAGRLVIRLLPYDHRWAFALAGIIGRLYQRKHGRML